MYQKHPGGRPLKFKSPEELEQKIAQYFADCQERWIDEVTYIPVFDEKGHKQKIEDGRHVYEEVVTKVRKKAVVPTISGLAVVLDTSRQTLLNYTESEQYFDTIKKAKQTIEFMTEALLINGGAHPTGVIFNLKNNWGWVDKTEVDQRIDANIGTPDPDKAKAYLDYIKNRE